MNFFKVILNKARENLSKIYHARGTTHEIALGAAIGSFWGVFPTFGLSTILTLILYKIIRFNVLVAIAAAFISNPLTSPFLLSISYQVGYLFTEVEFKLERSILLSDLPRIGYTLFLGSAVVSTVTAISVYFLTRFFVHKRRIHKQMKAARL